MDPTNEQHLSQLSTPSVKPAFCFSEGESTYHVDERASLDPPLLRTAGLDPFILILAVRIDDLCSQNVSLILCAIRRQE